MSAGAQSFAAALGGTIRFLAAGNREKLTLKKLYWKPGAMIKPVFASADELAAVAVDELPSRIGLNQNHVDSQIKGIEFSSGGEETKMLVKLDDEGEIRLRVASHTFLN